MTILTWTEDYAVNNSEMDRQHRALFDTINTLYTAITERRERTVIDEAFKALKDYTDYHFTQEEAMLREAGYDDLPLHQASHAQLRKELLRVEELFKKRGLAAENEIMSFLVGDWILEHITGIDLQYARQLPKATVHVLHPRR